MLHATGMTKSDLNKAQVGIASMWYEGNPCNMHLLSLGEKVKQGVQKAGLVGLQFNTIGVSDGMSMGTEGMSFSLQSRDLIADSIETVMGGQWYDANISIPGCDKNMPGCMIAIARLNRPAVFVYGGTILPGTHKGKDVDIVSIFEAVGKQAAGTITQEELEEVESCAIPGAGSCGGMYTANTMASAIEALGMSLPGSSSQDALSDNKLNDCKASGKAVMHLLDKDIKPSDIMTKKAFENAITVVIALGGSTNAVLHLLAMAYAIGVELDLDDFSKIGKKTPVLADLKPFGSHFMSQLNAQGGIEPVMKMLLEQGLLHGDCLTVTGKTLAENLKNIKGYSKDQSIIMGLDKPIKNINRRSKKINRRIKRRYYFPLPSHL